MQSAHAHAHTRHSLVLTRTSHRLSIAKQHALLHQSPRALCLSQLRTRSFSRVVLILTHLPRLCATDEALLQLLEQHASTLNLAVPPPPGAASSSLTFDTRRTATGSVTKRAAPLLSEETRSVTLESEEASVRPEVKLTGEERMRVLAEAAGAEAGVDLDCKGACPGPRCAMPGAEIADAALACAVLRWRVVLWCLRD